MITGSTLLFPVLGFPVDQVRAPAAFNEHFERNGIDAVVVPLEVPPDGYADFLRTLFRAPNVRGALVTVPHKRSTLQALDRMSERVRVAGACNAVRREPDGSLAGDLFDGLGFTRGLAVAGIPVAGRRVLLVGTGGAGAALAAALLEAGPAHLALHDLDAGSARALAGRLAPHAGEAGLAVAPNDPAGYDLVVNATPLGMATGDPLPFPVDRLSPGAVVADIVMKVDWTPVLRGASERGCRVHFGKEMLLAQMPLYLDFFGLGGSSRPGR